MEITEKLIDHFRTLGGKSICISRNKHGVTASIEFPFHEKDKNSKDIVYVLKSLKNKGKLKALTTNTQITNL